MPEATPSQALTPILRLRALTPTIPLNAVISKFNSVLKSLWIRQSEGNLRYDSWRQLLTGAQGSLPLVTIQTAGRFSKGS